MVWKEIDAVIEQRVFLGSVNAARSSKYLLGPRNITHILSVCNDHVPAKLPGFGYYHMRIPVEDIDYEDLLIHLPSACRFIHNALQGGGNVLVHSEAGISRGAAVVAAYLTWRDRIGVSEALDIVRNARDQIWPNAGFHEQLVLFQLCQYSPCPENGHYASWRVKIDRQLKAASMQ